MEETQGDVVANVDTQSADRMYENAEGTEGERLLCHELLEGAVRVNPKSRE